ncbi:MAG TPA: nucleotide sugar dehydrogenase, partial [Burkholderiaceae bacterium]|nr:nucleotide sugar dehydrogenase [Burkholderiaceae bacterium]
MKITVIGTGYVGLVTGVCFADVGNDVLCVDIDESKVQRLLHGEIPIHEPGLDDVAARNVRAGRLNFSSDYDRAIAHSDVFFIAVGTPTDEDGSADVRHVEAAARELGRRIRRQALLVVKSTVPVGTSERVRRAVDEELAARALKVAISVASNPEFLKEGGAVHDFMHPDRIVIGTEDQRAIDVLAALYAPFNRNR